MITPPKSLKFKVQKDEYRENVVIQLERINSEKPIKVKSGKVTNFSILTTRQQNRIGNKRTMPYEIIDQWKIGGLQNIDRYDKLNPVEIGVRDSEVNTYLSRYQRYKYRFVIHHLLFSSVPTNDTNRIFVSRNGLNETKESLINGKLFKTVGVINPSEIEFWDKVKGKSKWTNAVFTDSENPKVATHFTFAFTTTNLNDLLNFEFILLDDEAKPMKFPTNEDKVPVLTFTIQTIKWCVYREPHTHRWWEMMIWSS